MPNDPPGGTGAVPSEFGSETGTTRRSSLHGRKHPVHQPVYERHNTPIIAFLTVCTKDRKKILADSAAHELLLDSWREAKSWLVGRYVIMPDHVHLFCGPAELNPKPLLQWAGFWKSRSAQHWPRPNDRPVWQRHFWDTQLRRGESYDQKWDYVLQSPLRAGLADSTDVWPYQGEMHILRW